jgi:hypothetical protein
VKNFLEQQLFLGKQQKWMKKMLGYDFEIIYDKWKKNVVTYAFSKKEEDT